MSEQVQGGTERKVIPAKAAQMLMQAYQASQEAQQQFTVVLESVRAALDVPGEWQAQQMPEGSVWFVGPMASEVVPLSTMGRENEIAQ